MGSIEEMFTEWVNRDLVASGVKVEGIDGFLAGGNLKFRMPNGLELVLIRGGGKRIFGGVELGGVHFDDSMFMDVYLAVKIWARMRLYGEELLRLAEKEKEKERGPFQTGDKLCTD